MAAHQPGSRNEYVQAPGSYTATLIPSEGAWLEVETDANNVMWVRVGQTRKFALTTLLRALGAFNHPYGYEHVPVSELLGRQVTEKIVIPDMTATRPSPAIAAKLTGGSIEMPGAD